jgi:hypothetical protein
MTKSLRGLPLFLVALGVVISPPRAFSQEPDDLDLEARLNESHKVFEFPQGDPNLNQLILNRLQARHLSGFLEEFKKKGSVDEKKLTDFLKDWKVDSSKIPKGLPNILERIRKSDAPALSKDEINILLRELQAMQEAAARGTEESDLFPKKVTPQRAGGEESKDDQATGGGQAAPEADNQQGDASSPLAERLIGWAEKLGPTLRSSRALQRVMRDLNRYTGEEDPRWQQLNQDFKGVEERLGGLGMALHLDRLQPPGGISWPGGLSTGRLPGFRLPSGLGQSGGGALPGESSSSASQGWELALAAAGIIALIILLPRILARVQGRKAREADAAWQLGPWPVNPATIASREELIRGFEYLSLLCLGPAARNWNHRAIADRLRDAVSVSSTTWTPVVAQSCNPADELSLLYEQARYAPLTDPLPDTALATARRDLCLLAGVSGA